MYHGLLVNVINQTYPEERFATCTSCLNCQSPKSPYLSTKCCTYHPSLPNYLVGGILADSGQTGELGRARAQKLVASGIGVTPYGLLRPTAQASLRREVMPALRIPTAAEAESLLCTFYDRGHCTVWNYREHLCSTYFCYSVGGVAGKGFWRVVNEYLKLVEREFCLYALVTLGWPAEQLRLGNPLADWQPASSARAVRRRQSAWREWAGREADLYLECFRIISALDATAADRILGWKGRRLEERLHASLIRFTDAVIPERLQRAEATRVEDDEDNQVRVRVGAGPHAVVPRLVAAFLVQFDGVRSTSEVVRLAASLGIDLARHVGPLRQVGALNEPEEKLVGAG